LSNDLTQIRGLKSTIPTNTHRTMIDVLEGGQLNRQSSEQIHMARIKSAFYAMNEYFFKT